MTKKDFTTMEIENKAKELYSLVYKDGREWENASHWKRELFRFTAKQHLENNNSEKENG